MNFWDLVIIFILLAAAVLAVRHIIRVRKSGGCSCGTCAGTCSCAGSCSGCAGRAGTTGTDCHPC